MSCRLWKTEKSSIVHRTESVSMMHHGQSVVVSSTAADQIQRNFFFRILPISLVELPGRRVFQTGGDIGCRLLRQERTFQPGMMELFDGGTCRSANWPCTPPAAEVVANVNDPERQQWWSNFRRLCKTNRAAALSAFCRGWVWTANNTVAIINWTCNSPVCFIFFVVPAPQERGPIRYSEIKVKISVHGAALDFHSVYMRVLAFKVGSWENRKLLVCWHCINRRLNAITI